MRSIPFEDGHHEVSPSPIPQFVHTPAQLCRGVRTKEKEKKGE